MRETQVVYTESKKDEASDYYLFEEAMPKCRLEKTEAIILTPEQHKEDMIKFAIDFAEWIRKNCRDHSGHNYYCYLDGCFYQTEDLFKKYKQELTTKEIKDKH